MKNIAVFGYIELENRILLVKHAYGNRNWHLPGGSVEHHECIEDALLREVHEETGFNVEPTFLKGVIYSRENYAVSYLYKCTISGGSLRKNFDREIMDIGFFKKDSLPENISDYALDRIHRFNTDDLIVTQWDR